MDELRHELGTEDVDLSEIVVLGARSKVTALRRDSQQREDARRLLAERIRRGDTFGDPAAADEVRRTGWARG